MRSLPQYGRMRSRIARVRSSSPNRRLTLTEKIIYAHMLDDDIANQQAFTRGSSYLRLEPTRVAMQDASAQMAMLQFMSASIPKALVDASIHCDHLIQAYTGAEADLRDANERNSEIFEFLRSAARKYGIAFHPPGSGIIHQVVLENYAMPGTLLIGTDSHTPNAGGLGMMAVGVGGVDAAEVMAAMPWEIKAPKIVGVRLSGELQSWATPKDVVLYLCDRLTVSGATGSVLEYFGPHSLSCTGMATICNMGAEMGATTSLFSFNDAMCRYLRATHRSDIAAMCTETPEIAKDLLCADDDADYDSVIDIDLSTIRPRINGPFTPDRSHSVGDDVKSAATEHSWPTTISVGLIGSCTNSSYEDMNRCFHIVKQALAKGCRFKCPVTVTPGSEQIRATMERDGMLRVFEEAGATVLANACGPCIGQWRRQDDVKDNTILASFNRNFASRNDGNPRTFNFLSSPEVVIALSLAGDLAFDPLRDTLEAANGGKFKLNFPKSDELPTQGFADSDAFKVELAAADTADDVRIDEDSDRLQALRPFEPRASEAYECNILVKVKGKCTTDHISAAGVWLKYKGHLENISENTLIGAVNADTGNVNDAYSHATNEYGGTIPDVAKHYRDNGIPWVVIADRNYGEGSAREHAAMQPRYLGGVAVIARSFARIHEANLKKQGMLALVFADESDYDRISGRDRVMIDVSDLRPNIPVKITVMPFPKSASSFVVVTKHTMTEEQIQWFKAGSALNHAAANI